MRYILIPLLILVFSPFVNAQLLLKGEVKNAAGQPLSGALVADQATFSAVTTDKNGKFQLGLNPGKHSIAISHLGYKTIVDSLIISENIEQSYSMMINPIISEEFVVEALRANASTPMTFQNISGEELITIVDIDKGIKPRDEVSCEVKYKDGTSKTIKVLCRIDTQNEVEYYKNGGILQYVLRNMLN